MATSKGLGKGLGALFGDMTPTASAGNPVSLNLPIQKIEPNPHQPRKVFSEEELQDLSDSIAIHGIIQPLTVRLMESGYYQIIAGERRWRAARMAKLEKVPVVVIEADDKKAMELALIENLQRQDLNPVEEALGYQTLIAEYGMSQEQASLQVGKSRPAVANALRLLGLPKQILQMVSDGKITAGHARAVLTIKNEKQQLSAAQKISALALSVRQAELMCRSIANDTVIQSPLKEIKVDYIAECEKNLSRRLGRGVKIISGKRKGKLNLDFYSPDDLELLLEILEHLPHKESKKQ